MARIDKKEVLRYLGHNNQVVDEHLNEMIDETIQKMNKVTYNYIYKKFDITKGDTISVLGTSLELKGMSIKNILKYSDEIIIFAATLGQSIDKQINSLKYGSLTEMMILDACASEMIEEVLNDLEKEINGKYNKYLAPRFSPGYGDLSLEYQKPIIKILDASKKIGLMVSKSLILMPKKSVTGIIGLQNENRKVDYRPCDDCLSREVCDFTKCKKGV